MTTIRLGNRPLRQAARALGGALGRLFERLVPAGDAVAELPPEELLKFPIF